MEIKLVNVSYKDIFKNLNLTIKDNGVYSVLGYSCELFNLIYGLDKNFTGEICVGRNKFTNVNKREINNIRKNVLYLTEDYENELFNINVFEDIKYGIHNVSEVKMYEFLKNFGLDNQILKKSYLSLSSGEKKKILLIKALISDAKILLFDDITSGLDGKTIDTLVKLLKREKKNRIILMSSVDSNFLLSSSDNFILMDSGEIICDKYQILSDKNSLNKMELNEPSILFFKDKVLKKKGIKLVNRDNVNDLLKDVYRNVSR